MSIAPGFEAAAELLASYGAEDATYSAQLAVLVGGETVLDLAVGPELTTRTLLPVFSSSNATIAIVVGLLMDRGVLRLDDVVASVWPEFATEGKAGITVRQLLSHQAGLVGVDDGFTAEELLSHEPLAKRLAEQRPYWQPGKTHGYHALTLGTLADELVRRLTGSTLAQLWAAHVVSPHAVDVHLVRGQEQRKRFAPISLPTPEEMLPFAHLRAHDDGLRLVVLPPQLPPLPVFVNTDAFLEAGLAAGGAVASAAGLARLYARVNVILAPDTLAQLTQLQVDGDDQVLGLRSRFAITFQKPGPNLAFGSFRAFGHDGLGGALGFHDPTYDMSFGYVPKRMPLPGGADYRALGLATAVRDCVLAFVKETS